MKRDYISDHNEILRKRLTVKLVLSVLLFVVTYSITLKLSVLDAGDYIPHIEWADNLFNGVTPVSSYPLWHLCVKTTYEILHLVFPVTIEYIAILISSITIVLLYWIVTSVIEKSGCEYPELISFPLMFVTALYLPWFNTNIYLGQGSPNTWHSPTAIIVKPFAVIAFFLIADVCRRIRNNECISRSDYISILILILLSVLSKPSFFQGIVPALGIYIIISLINDKAKGIKQYSVLVLAFVPAALVVLIQFFTSFYSGDSTGVSIGWMEVWKYYSPHPLFSFCITICFPLLYIILNHRKALKTTSIQISLLYVLCSFLEYALLYENGSRKYHANFSWALNLSYFIMWIVTSICFFKDWQAADLSDKRKSITNSTLLVIWLLHFASGLYYAGLFIFHEGFAF